MRRLGAVTPAMPRGSAGKIAPSGSVGIAVRVRGMLLDEEDRCGAPCVTVRAVGRHVQLALRLFI